MEYFEKLIDLLKTERREDQQAYTNLTSKASVAERRAMGTTWYPVAIRGEEIGVGDYVTVEIERTTHQELPHQFRFGGAAVLFSQHDASANRIEGVIAYINGNQLKIRLNTDELPDWSGDGKLGIDLLFDDNSYDEMTAALKTASILVKKEEEGRLIKILTGEKPPVFQTGIADTALQQLNDVQLKAVHKILSANDLAIVHGPPGTGKTTTLVQAIKALIKQDGKQILVVAPSNTAVDLLSEKLSAEGLNVLRIGNPARVSERLMSLTLDNKMINHSRIKDTRVMKKQANEFIKMAHKYKRNFGYAEREQRKALLNEARKIMKEVGRTEQYIIDDLLSKAQVIAATLVGANHYTAKHLSYHTVVIDEAGQALEPACWIPVLKAKKLVLAGDHCQLPPTVRSPLAARQGLGNTLFEKVVALYPEAFVLLEEQYRMNREIMGYASKVFYEDKLTAHASVADHLLFTGDQPLLFIDTAGCGFDEKSEGTSTSNPEEAAFLFKHLHALVAELQKQYSVENFPCVAVISPYKQQISVLKELLLHQPVLQIYRDKIAVNTIDSFQGQERDIVYISMTRSNPDMEIGFLADIRRMNVAMTRARKKLVVIGDSATLSKLPFYSNFISYAEELNAYKSAWEFMND